MKANRRDQNAAPHSRAADLKSLRATLRARRAELRTLVAARKAAGKTDAFKLSPAWRTRLLVEPL